MSLHLFICSVLTLTGGTLAVAAGLRYRLLQKKFPKLPRHEAFFSFATIFPALAGGGLLAAAAALLIQEPLAALLLFSGITLLCGVYLFLFVKSHARTVAALKEAPPVMGKALQTVSDVAARLFDADPQTFDATLTGCMEAVGRCVDADRVTIWKKHVQDGSLYSSQLHEWSREGTPVLESPFTVAMPLSDTWHALLAANRCVNGIARDFTGFEKKQLTARGILSLLIIPVFRQEKLWGAVVFSDYRRERLFSEREIDILRPASSLLVSAMFHNANELALKNERDKAVAAARAKTEFLANISHGVRTPMHAITGMINIARTTSDKERLQACLDHIDAASRQLLSTVNDVLDMSKIEAGKLELSEEPFELVPLLHNVKSLISVQALEKKQSIGIELVPPLPQVLVGDELRITQVLLNLLANAVKFTPENGEIHLRASSVSSSYTGYVDLAVSVSDTGIGMTQEQVRRIFSTLEEPEYGIARRFAVAGLGLSICKNLVALMNGAIEVQTAPGEGSTFTAHFRIRQGSRDMLPAKSGFNSPLEGIFSGKRLLLVDDIAINREIVMTLMEKTGITIDTAQNGQEAVEMYKAAPEKYDAILMDVQMPLKDGYAATEEIRAIGTLPAKSVPIIAMTVHAFEEDIKRSMAAGMTEHIAKPIEFDTLVAKLSLYLR